ncbi:MAG TPA: flagellar basal body P-ring formation chaperone FlgA [Bryobacteraceae bacterium]|jgi:flagella basal body P-ring formation protein FlgA|nr:flagellar basal body P-ring formation chaperone FlgA [Bryobacteraceae bacterium]
MAAAATAVLACQTIDGDRIAGKDLAAANPIFAAIDPAAILGPAPLPGAQRIFHSGELLRVARQAGIELAAPLSEICFVRATDPLTPQKLFPFLRAALSLDNAKIEILDFSRVAIPRGAIDFSRAGLSPAGLWRGRVNFGENQSMPIWARVRITTEQTWIEAAAPLAPGKPIDVSQLRQVSGPRFPFGAAPISSINDAAGRTVLRAVKPGEPIFANMLIAARQIERGDTVRVDVSSGAAHLSFEAISQTAGRAGELILLKNPENGRYFQARVEGKDKASITK